MLSEAEQNRIAAAVGAAEANTSGEIVCIYERRLVPDRATPILVGAVAALALPPAVVLAQLALGFSLFGGGNVWSAAHPTSGAEAMGVLGELVLLQTVSFAASYLLFRIPQFRRWTTPRSVKRARAQRAALDHFLSRGIHLTRDRTGILIFVVEEDHQVEIIADKGIHEKVADTVWGDAVAALASGLRRGDAAGGFEAAIGKCGEVLAAHFPPRADDVDELANRIVLID